MKDARATAVLRALRRMIVETGRMGLVAERLRQDLGWTCTHESALSRVSQMLNPQDPHRFPAEMLPAVIEETGVDYVTPLLLRVKIAA